MDYKVVYNSFTIGGAATTNAQVDSVSYVERDAFLSVEVDFVLFGSSVAAYSALEDTMLAALREPEAALVITHGATTLFTGDPSTFTISNVETSVTQIDDEDYTTDVSRRWRFSLSAQTPVTKAADANKVEASTELSYDDSRLRIVRITGTYLASSASSARANHTANFATYAAARLLAVASGGTFDLVAEGPVANDFRDGVCTFAAVYREVYYSTGVSNVSNETITFTRSAGVLDSPTRFSVSCSYTGSVDSTAVANGDLPATVASVRTTVLAKAIALFTSSGTGYIENFSEDTGSTNSTIHARYTIVLAASGFSFRRLGSISLSYSTSRIEQVTIGGGYQADDGGDSAKTKHDADIATFVTAVFSTLSLTEADFELVSEAPITLDDDDQECSFSRTYEFKNYTTAISGTRRERIQFVRLASFSHGNSAAIAPVRVQLIYRAAADRATIAESALASTWLNTIRPVLITKAQTMFGGSALIERERVAVDPTTNEIVADLTMLMDGVGDNILSETKTVEYAREVHTTFRNKWDGNPTSAFHWTSGWTIGAITSLTQVSDRATVTGDNSPGNPPESMQPGEGEWLLVGQPMVSSREFTMGTNPESGGIIKTFYEAKSVAVWRWTSAGDEVAGRGPSANIHSVKASDIDVTVL